MTDDHSPATRMSAARGLADMFFDAGIPQEAILRLLSDHDFAATVSEQLVFQNRGHRPTEEDSGAMLVLAVRYAAGRSTAAVHSVIDDVEAGWSELLPVHQEAIHIAIRRQEVIGQLGMDVEVERWSRILELPISQDITPAAFKA